MPVPLLLTLNFIRFLLPLHEKFKNPSIQELGPQNELQYHPFATKIKERKQNHTKSESFHEPDCLINCQQGLVPMFCRLLLTDLHAIFKRNHLQAAWTFTVLSELPAGKVVKATFLYRFCNLRLNIEMTL